MRNNVPFLLNYSRSSWGVRIDMLVVGCQAVVSGSGLAEVISIYQPK